MLTDEDLKQIDKIVERHSASDDVGCLTGLVVLIFLGLIIKGC